MKEGECVCVCTWRAVVVEVCGKRNVKVINWDSLSIARVEGSPDVLEAELGVVRAVAAFAPRAHLTNCLLC